MYCMCLPSILPCEFVNASLTFGNTVEYEERFLNEFKSVGFFIVYCAFGHFMHEYFM